MRRRSRPVRSIDRRYRSATVQPLPSLRTARERRASRRGLRQAETHEINQPRAVSITLLVTLAFIAAWLGLDDTFYVRKITVTGNPRVPAAEIVSGSGIAGTHVLWVNSSAVEAALLDAVPSIRAARVSCLMPADCTIAVIEREPFAVWRWGQAMVWIDRDGVVFAAYGDAPGVVTVDAGDAPVLVTGQSVGPDVLAAIVTIVDALPEVRAFRYSVLRGLEFDDPDGYPVYLGTGSNLDDRIAVWRALRADLASRNIAPAYIDVRFPLAPYYAPQGEALGVSE